METVSENKTPAYNNNITHTPGLTSSEIGNLWNTYVINSLVTCFKKSYLANVDDKNARSLLKEALAIETQRLRKITDIFQKENLPVPMGFSDSEDVNFKAPRLFSDNFYLYYLLCYSKFDIPINSINFVTSTRSDVLKFYAYCSNSFYQLFEHINNTILSKGLYIRPPYVTTSHNIDLVKKQSFLTGFLGEKRPLLAQEVSSVFHVILHNNTGKCLLTGFRQVVRSKKVRDYIDRGIKLASKVSDTFSAILQKEDIPVPISWDTMVTESTVPPFSDRLIMSQTALLNTCGVLDFTNIMVYSYRHDIKANLLRLMPASGDFAEDGINILIENGWLEEPPRTVDRRKLVNELQH
ncbi:MAG: DUF3231 family protein [Firmicutes bacterium]|nr:DUF3231 family protein [Bacillota bacterium]